MGRGDHFFVWRRHGGIVFQHHAIDLGDGTVVHFTDGRDSVAGPGGAVNEFKILRTPVEVVTRENKDTPHIVDHDQRFDADMTVERAISQVGRQGYHLWFDNCEHFACWCVADRHESRQIAVACERMSSVGIKTFAVGSMHLATKLGVKHLSRSATPWLLVADAVQWAAEAGGHHVGLRDPKKRKRASRAAGMGTALSIGVIGGPAGVVLAGGFWVAGEAVGEMSRVVYETARLRRAETRSVHEVLEES